MRNIFYLLLIIGMANNLFAQDCDLTQPDFPVSACSFVDSGVVPQQLRFGRLNFGRIDYDPFLRLGAQVYMLAENVVIYDTRNSSDECIPYDDTFFDETVAFVINGDSLNAPRVIDKLWILDCDINTVR